MSYIGRFAPSPTGPLHFGSLLAALASWLEARQAGGRWLVRIEDVDRLREQPGAADAILRSLESFGLAWDGEVLRQSGRGALYQARLAELQAQELIYRCDCSRTQLKARGARSYDRYCFSRQLSAASEHALRLRVDGVLASFADVHQGELAVAPGLAGEDFIVRRKEGFWSYQFAVVVDDIAQGVTDIVRGSDLVDSTPGQLYLHQVFGLAPPRVLHIPVALGPDGQKLSKQTFAAPLAEGSGAELVRALDFLGQAVPAELRAADCAELLAWALVHWRRASMPRSPARPAC